MCQNLKLQQKRNNKIFSTELLGLARDIFVYEMFFVSEISGQFHVLYFSEKILKIQLFSLHGLWFVLQKCHWIFKFFLRSLMPKKSSGMQKSYFWTEFHHKKINKPKIPFWITVAKWAEYIEKQKFVILKIWKFYLPHYYKHMQLGWVKLGNRICCQNFTLFFEKEVYWVGFQGRPEVKKSNLNVHIDYCFWQIKLRFVTQLLSSHWNSKRWESTRQFWPPLYPPLSGWFPYQAVNSRDSRVLCHIQ